MGDYTAAERIGRFREKRLKAGLVETRIWTRPELIPLLRSVAELIRPDQVGMMLDVVQAAAAAPNQPAPTAIRIAVDFPSKPPVSVRDQLKKVGLKWDGKQWWGWCEDHAHVERMRTGLAAVKGTVRLFD